MFLHEVSVVGLDQTDGTVRCCCSVKEGATRNVLPSCVQRHIRMLTIVLLTIVMSWLFVRSLCWHTVLATCDKDEAQREVKDS